MRPQQQYYSNIVYTYSVDGSRLYFLFVLDPNHQTLPVTLQYAAEVYPVPGADGPVIQESLICWTCACANILNDVNNMINLNVPLHIVNFFFFSDLTYYIASDKTEIGTNGCS